MALPRPPSRNHGVLLLRGGEGRDRDGEGIGRGREGGREGKGEGRGIAGKGKGGEWRGGKERGGTNLPSLNPGSAADLREKIQFPCFQFRKVV